MQFDDSLESKETYERGALLLTVLAGAKEIDEERSLQLYLSLCGHALWVRHLTQPDDWTPITVKPQYVFRDPKIIERDASYVAKRLGERMVAARMAIPFFLKPELGLQEAWPKQIRRRSINQMAEFVLDDSGQAESGNVERRIWAPSRPVIHLAVAAAIIGQKLLKSGHKVAFDRLLADRTLIEEIAMLAEVLEMLVATDPKFPIKADQLIRFRLG
jgi:hypothetical protein